MPKHTIAAGAALLLCSTPAFADLSAQDIWADWQAFSGTMGQTMTATSDNYSGGVLTLEGVTAGTTIGDATSTANYGTISLVEQGDGTVKIEIPSTLQMQTTTNIGSETIEQSVEMTTTGWDATIREEGDARIYDIKADGVVYIMEDISGGEAEGPVPLTLTFSNVATTYSNTAEGDALSMINVLAADSMTIQSSAEGEETFALDYTLTGLTSEFDGTMMPPADGTGQFFNLGGMLMTGAMAHSGGTMSLTANTESGPLAINGTSGSGSLALDLNGDSLGYTLTSNDAQMAIEVAALPVPVNISMAEATTGFAFPVGVSNDPKPYGLTIAYRDLVIDDALWGLFDPTGQLPRDAATILLDVSGTALMTKDIFGDPEAMAAGGPPGELKTMDLTQLQVSLAGAELTGSGAVEFPNPGPIPQPVGKVNLSLDGGLGLVDKLVALGFVPAEQAAFIKGMAGVVARPVGEDQLESEIEFTPGGGITANGLPLQ